MTIDEYGLLGMYTHYATVFFLVGGALMIFAYLWYQGRLDMDEEPKWQMLKDNGEEHGSRS